MGKGALSAVNMPTYHISIAEKIKEYRNKNRLTQKEFGELIGVSAQAVCKWEQNICYPDILFLPQLAKILGCTTNDFFVNDEEKPKKNTG